MNAFFGYYKILQYIATHPAVLHIGFGNAATGNALFKTTKEKLSATEFSQQFPKTIARYRQPSCIQIYVISQK